MEVWPDVQARSVQRNVKEARGNICPERCKSASQDAPRTAPTGTDGP
jgi:hypothetical protein